LIPIRADLHIHTLLSPCADETMTPARIVQQALQNNLQMIAICDHNAAANIDAVLQAAKGKISVLCGMEITTSEEVHVLGYFPNTEAAHSLAYQILQTLPILSKKSQTIRQSVVDELGIIIRQEQHILSAAGQFSLSQIVSMIHDKGGLAVASHIDRPAFGVIGHLGFIPDDVPFDAVEITPYSKIKPTDFPIISSSDSHYPDDIGSVVTTFEMNEPTFDEFSMTLKSIGGRRIISIA
jgi:PHP family Zn ribbon phosphoesterase